MLIVQKKKSCYAAVAAITKKDQLTKNVCVSSSTSKSRYIVSRLSAQHLLVCNCCCKRVLKTNENKKATQKKIT